MSRVFISVGHGGRDPGAVANSFRESDLALSVATFCLEELRRHKVVAATSRTSDIDDDVNRQVRLAREFNPTLAIDIHFNAGGGKGFEVFHSINPRKNEINLCRNIEAEFKEIGQNSRGLKTRVGNNNTDFFGFIRMLEMPSVIVECAFIDNALDLLMFNTKDRQKAMGKAIARGVLETLNIPILRDVDEEGEEYMVTRLELTRNGKNITTSNIFHEGKNYVELRDYEESYGSVVNFDNATKNIAVTSPPPRIPDVKFNDLKFNIEGNKFEIDGQMLNDANLVRARDLLENLGYKVTWENNIVIGERLDKNSCKFK